MKNSLSVPPIRHCERNEVKRGNPESDHVKAKFQLNPRFWVAAAFGLAMTARVDDIHN
jgi:hypothetical protein